MTQLNLFIGPDSQAGAILEYLETGASITPLEALHKFGCFRLGARVWDLRQAGHRIESQLVSVGNGKRVASYRLRNGDG